MVLKYGMDIDDTVVINVLKKATNQIYKLLPMREEGGDWQKPLETIIEELAGMSRMINISQETYATLIFKLEGLFLLSEEKDFQLYRRIIFECLSLCGILKEGLACQD